METLLPWRHTRGFLSSPTYFVETPHWCRSSRKPMRCPRHREMRAFVFCVAWRAFASPLSKLHRRLDSLYATQWAPRNTRRDSRGKQNPLLPLETRPDSQMSLECNPEIPVAPVEEHYLLDRSLDEVSFALQLLESIPSSPSQLEWKIGLPWANTRGSQNSPS